MRVLAIDTSFDACSAAIVEDHRTLWSRTRVIGRGHSEVLPVMAAEGFAATSLSAHDIDRIGVVIGPGTFAGVRVGLAFARALCLGTRASAIGTTSLEALAASVGEGPIAPVFDARRGQVYAALYDEQLRELIAPFVAAPDEAARRIAAGCADVILCGSGSGLVAPHFAPAPRSADRLHIDPVAVAQRVSAAAAPVVSPSPLYLRPPDAVPSSGSILEAETAL